MALADGLKGFIQTIVSGITGDSGEDIDYGDPFRGLTQEGGYADGSEVIGNTATKPDIDTLYPKQKSSRFETNTSSNVTVMPNAYKAGEVAVVEPRSFSEAAQIIKRLLDSKTVVVNLDLLDGLQSQRTIDFVSGATHALSGSSQKISDKVFIFTPSSIALSVENAASQNKFSEALWNKPL